MHKLKAKVKWINSLSFWDNVAHLFPDAANLFASSLCNLSSPVLKQILCGCDWIISSVLFQWNVWPPSYISPVWRLGRATMGRATMGRATMGRRPGGQNWARKGWLRLGGRGGEEVYCILTDHARCWVRAKVAEQFIMRQQQQELYLVLCCMLIIWLSH